MGSVWSWVMQFCMLCIYATKCTEKSHSALEQPDRPNSMAAYLGGTVQIFVFHWPPEVFFPFLNLCPKACKFVCSCNTTLSMSINKVTCFVCSICLQGYNCAVGEILTEKRNKEAADHVPKWEQSTLDANSSSIWHNWVGPLVFILKKKKEKKIIIKLFQFVCLI